MTASALREFYVDRCERLAGLLSLRGERTLLLDIAAQAAEPLRVAVTGDVSAGKSSLVNALLGRRVAAVRREETTAAVTWYRAAGARVPPPLGAEHRSEVVAAPVLRGVVLIDTPGVNTVSGRQRPSEAMLDAAEGAAGSASALVHLSVGEPSKETVRRLRAFASLTGGALDAGAGVALAASKADALVGDDLAGRAELVATVRARAGRWAGHALAVAPATALAARDVAGDPELVGQLGAIATSPQLVAAARAGWPALAAALDATPRPGVPPVSVLARWESLVGTTAAITAAADVLVAGPPDPGAAIAARWRALGGLEELERVLAVLAAHADVLTVSAVRGRLLRLAGRLGGSLGAPLRAVVAEADRHPGRAWHERRAAALVLEGNLLSHVPPTERAAAAAMLRGEGDGPAPDVVAWWHRQAEQPGRSAAAQYVAGLVARAAVSRLEGEEAV